MGVVHKRLYTPRFVKLFYIVGQFEVTGIEIAAIILSDLKKYCIGTIQGLQILSDVSF